MREPTSISRDTFIRMVTISWVTVLLLGGAWVASLYYDYMAESASLRENHYRDQRAMVREEVQRGVALVEKIRRGALNDLWQMLHARVEQALTMAQSLGARPELAPVAVRRIVADTMAAGAGDTGLAVVRGDTVLLVDPVPASVDSESIIKQLVLSLDGVRDGDRSIGVFDRTMGIEMTFLAVVRTSSNGERIIAGACLEKAEQAVQDLAADQLELLRFDGDNYLFGGDWNGISKIGPARGRNMWGVTDINGVRVVQELVAAAKRGGDFVNYIMPGIDGQPVKRKMSYVLPVPDWDWYIGAGLYVDDIESVLVRNEQALRRGINRQLILTFAGLVLLSLLAYVMARRLARSIDANVEAFIGTWDRSASSGGSVDIDNLRYKEFRVLAEASNRMAEECRDAELAMRENADRFQTLVSNIPGCVFNCSLDDDCTMFYMSDAIEDITGYPASDFILNAVRSFASIIDPEDRDRVKTTVADDINAGRPYSLEYRIIHASGQSRWVSCRGKGRYDELGRLMAVDGVLFDISDKRRNERQRYVHMHFLETMERLDRDLRRGVTMEAMLGDALETVRKAFGADRAWLLTPCDPEARQITVPMERTVPEYPGLGAGGVPIPVTRETRWMMELALEASGPVAFDPASGHAMPGEIDAKYNVKSRLVAAIYPMGSAPWLMGLHQCREARIWNSDEIQLFKEVSRRVSDALSNLLMHKELKESEEKFRTFSEQTMLGMAVIQDDHFIFANQAFADIFEMSVGDVVGYPLENFVSLCHPDDRDFVVEQGRRKQSGDPDVVPSYVWRTLPMSGKTRWVENHSKTVTLHGRHADLISVMDITDSPRDELEAKLRKRYLDAGEAFPEG